MIQLRRLFEGGVYYKNTQFQFCNIQQAFYHFTVKNRIKMLFIIVIFVCLFVPFLKRKQIYVIGITLKYAYSMFLSVYAASIRARR